MSEIKRLRLCYSVSHRMARKVPTQDSCPIASDNNFTISELESDSDHIHPLVDCATVSEHTEAQIRTYIQNQKVK
ncbi:hypothetical protein D3C81_2217540 [compost metagenome]